MPSIRERKHLGRSAIHWTNFRQYFQVPRRRRLPTQPTTPPAEVSPVAVQTNQQPSQQNQDDLEKLIDAVDKSQHILIECRAVFPFDLFPDSIVVDRQKLTITHRTFFFVEQMVGVQHKDLKNVEADVGPFFGSVTVTSEHFVNNTQNINFLWRKDAVKIQRMIQGLIVACREDIDITSIEEEKALVKLLDELGSGEITKQP